LSFFLVKLSGEGTGFMTDDGILRARARHAMSTGRLPRHRPDRMWGGPGNGATCAVCGQAVSRAEMGFDLEFAGGTSAPSAVNHQFHVRCFAAWEFELDSVEHAHRAHDEPAQLLRTHSGEATINSRERDRFEPGGPE
jgi:hypothetical protein